MKVTQDIATHLTLYRTADDGRKHTLKWSMYNGRPRATVVINTKDGEVMTRDNYINFRMDSDTVVAIMGYMDMLLDDPSAGKRITSKIPVYKDNVRTDEKEVESIMTLSVSSSGVYYISFKKGSKSEIYFPLAPTKYWHLVNDFADGQVGDESNVARDSKYYAKNYFYLLKLAFSDLLVRDVQSSTIEY